MHIPVMVDEILNFSCNLGRKPVRYLDATYGRGGHARRLALEFPNLECVFVDRDQAAIDAGKSDVFWQNHRVTWVHATFGDYLAQCDSNFDLILVDLGVSSPQLDEAERGFSFYQDGPLDMRMNTNQELTAATIVNTAAPAELLYIFGALGDIRHPGRVVRAIVARRERAPIRSTTELSGLIEQTEGWRKKHSHPATQFFQALRIAVNNELEPLPHAISNFVGHLEPGGILLMLSFHSLEDRIVKWGFRDQQNRGSILTKRVVCPSIDEIERNPRARSAKLRVFKRND